MPNIQFTGVPEYVQLTFKEFCDALFDTVMELRSTHGIEGTTERVLIRDSIRLLSIAMDAEEVTEGAVGGVVAEAAQIAGRKNEQLFTRTFRHSNMK